MVETLWPRLRDAPDSGGPTGLSGNNRKLKFRHVLEQLTELYPVVGPPLPIY